MWDWESVRATVEDHKAETLIPIIKKWISPGTNTISECWSPYVNNSLKLVDPESGAHKNSIENGGQQ